MTFFLILYLYSVHYFITYHYILSLNCSHFVRDSGVFVTYDLRYVFLFCLNYFFLPCIHGPRKYEGHTAHAVKRSIKTETETEGDGQTGVY